MKNIIKLELILTCLSHNQLIFCTNLIHIHIIIFSAYPKCTNIVLECVRNSFPKKLRRLYLSHNIISLMCLSVSFHIRHATMCSMFLSFKLIEQLCIIQWVSGNSLSTREIQIKRIICKLAVFLGVRHRRFIIGLLKGRKLYKNTEFYSIVP